MRGHRIQVVELEAIIIPVVVEWGFVVNGHSAEPAWELVTLGLFPELLAKAGHVAGFFAHHGYVTSVSVVAGIVR